MKNARTHTSTMHPNMSTKNRGTILAAERGTLKGKGSDGHNVRNAFEEPADFQGGPGGTDPCNIVDGDWI